MHHLGEYKGARQEIMLFLTQNGLSRVRSPTSIIIPIHFSEAKHHCRSHTILLHFYGNLVHRSYEMEMLSSQLNVCLYFPTVMVQKRSK